MSEFEKWLIILSLLTGNKYAYLSDGKSKKLVILKDQMTTSIDGAYQIVMPLVGNHPENVRELKAMCAEVFDNLHLHEVNK